jgi:hypothetical protein
MNPKPFWLLNGSLRHRPSPCCNKAGKDAAYESEIWEKFVGLTQSAEAKRSAELDLR